MPDTNKIACEHRNTKVIRTIKEEFSIRRYRECNNCGALFWTTEKKDIPRIMVIKRNGVRERFSYERLLGSISKACAKLSIDDSRIEIAAQKIADQISVDKEIESYVIGQLVLDQLEKLSGLAWLRFASYYVKVKRESDLNPIKAAMKELL